RPTRAKVCGSCFFPRFSNGYGLVRLALHEPEWRLRDCSGDARPPIGSENLPANFVTLPPPPPPARSARTPGGPTNRRKGRRAQEEPHEFRARGLGPRPGRLACRT